MYIHITNQKRKEEEKKQRFIFDYLQKTYRQADRQTGRQTNRQTLEGNQQTLAVCKTSTQTRRQTV